MRPLAAVRHRAAAAHALALLIAVYGGLLRLDAFVVKYGTLDRPACARIATQEIAPLGASLRPSSVVWGREARPYVGGDPINYLKFAREMNGFYQGHVREPVFLAITRAGLWALDGQDAAVSFASLVGSTLAVFATYLLASALLSRPAGLVASLLLAVEYEAITWAPDGWRDDTFTATVLFAAWALIRLRERPSSGSSVLAGGLCGVSCLTRITALSFIVPALVWLIADGAAPPRREKAKHAALALGVLAVVVAPYLISCARATGDPFVAINYHTTYYRYAEGRPITEPMSAAGYLRTKLAERPIATLDTALNGLFLQPFITKWNGFGHWVDGLDEALRWLALAGAAALPFFAAGRLLIVILLTSLAPYMLTWNVGGGGEWRFTMHAYPFYLVAAACAIVGAVRLVVWLAANRALPGRTIVARLAVRAGAVLVVAALGVAAYFVLPWFVTREAIASGDSTSVDTGERDLLFYRHGWSPAHQEGITVRVSRGERSVVRIPLAARRDYDIVLRIDPVDPETQGRVSVLFNRHLVGLLRLSWDPERVGSYRVRVREDMVRSTNKLTIIPDTLVSAGSAGPRFAWLDAADRIGVRLWYVRILPSP
jgi:Dolichyl-phosphate-mannose-protein mannosyltransferase